MNTHPYLRAYLAGVFFPTLGLPVMFAEFLILRFVCNVSFPIERGLVFPLALVPVAWGLWNMLRLALRPTRPIPSGLHGAILPLLLLPAGACIATRLGILALGSHGVTWFQNLYVPYALIAPCFLAAIAGYYLVWKYVVGFLNRTLGIA
jgi:hypothetical protein